MYLLTQQILIELPLCDILVGDTEVKETDPHSLACIVRGDRP